MKRYLLLLSVIFVFMGCSNKPDESYASLSWGVDANGKKYECCWVQYNIANYNTDLYGILYFFDDHTTFSRTIEQGIDIGPSIHTDKMHRTYSVFDNEIRWYIDGIENEVYFYVIAEHRDYELLYLVYKNDPAKYLIYKKDRYMNYLIP